MSSYHNDLHGYLGRQRWFAGKDRDFEVVDVAALPSLTTAPLVRVEFVTVRYVDGEEVVYQVPTVYLDALDPQYQHALMGTVDDGDGERFAYDAVHVKAGTHTLLTALLENRTDEHLSFVTVEGTALPDAADQGTMMTAEQSNTSIAFGDSALLKVFRQVSDGRNPDVEIHHRLTVMGSTRVAPLLGWYEGRWRDVHGHQNETHLGMFQAYLRTATDGWDIALASVRDLLVEEPDRPSQAGGDFSAEAERLGEATAEVHRQLAEAFGTSRWERRDLDRIVDTMLARLDRVATVVPAVAPHAEGVRAVFEGARATPLPVDVHRIHGDLHLGQTLRTVKGWKLIDFEGQPARPLAERRANDSPLRDVAGMTRSFDYAAQSARLSFGPGDDARLTELANAWTERNRRAFLRGYADGSTLDLVTAAPLLRAFEADKAVYEVGYEAGNRPTWTSIPLHAVEQLATSG